MSEEALRQIHHEGTILKRLSPSRGTSVRTLTYRQGTVVLAYPYFEGITLLILKPSLVLWYDRYSMNDLPEDYTPHAEVPEEGVEIPFDQLAPDTLNGVIEAFILRNGTDYGTEEVKLETKVAQVKRQLERGEAVIVYDAVSETCSIQPQSKSSRRSN